MSRRDTIILAVLLNTGLLAVLFIIAVNPDSDQFSSQLDVQQPLVEVQKTEPVKEYTSVVLAHESKTDEVDNVLKDFAATLNVENVTSPSLPPQPRHQQYDDELLAMNITQKRQPQQPQFQQSTNYQKPAQPSHTTKSTQEPEYVEVTVKRGDILGRIAQANNTTVSAIKNVNHLTSDTLQVGQVLKVPVDTKATNKKQIASNPTYQNDGFTRFYTVQSGDNPWKIAKKFNVSVRELLRLNDLDEGKARNLRPGDRIRVQ